MTTTAKPFLTDIKELRRRAQEDIDKGAVTPGQAAVFYDGDLVLGGGWIE